MTQLHCCSLPVCRLPVLTPPDVGHAATACLHRRDMFIRCFRGRIYIFQNLRDVKKKLLWCVMLVRSHLYCSTEQAARNRVLAGWNWSALCGKLHRACSRQQEFCNRTVKPHVLCPALGQCRQCKGGEHLLSIARTLAAEAQQHSADAAPVAGCLRQTQGWPASWCSVSA